MHARAEIRHQVPERARLPALVERLETRGLEDVHGMRSRMRAGAPPDAARRTRKAIAARHRAQPPQCPGRCPSRPGSEGRADRALDVVLSSGRTGSPLRLVAELLST